jgi:hypothetical protein
MLKTKGSNLYTKDDNGRNALLCYMESKVYLTVKYLLYLDDPLIEKDIVDIHGKSFVHYLALAPVQKAKSNASMTQRRKIELFDKCFQLVSIRYSEQ